MLTVLSLSLSDLFHSFYLSFVKTATGYTFSVSVWLLDKMKIVIIIIVPSNALCASCICVVLSVLRHISVSNTYILVQ